ncbi:MAG: hypothetical protein PVH19_07070 [Planctomycetia bacterium]|jgi:hypothetical protein
MSKPTLSQKIRYRFDSFMAKGGFSIFLSLTIVFLGIFIFLTLVRGLILLSVENPMLHYSENTGFFQNMYIIFLQMTDPGNMAQDINSSVIFKTTTVLAGLSGVIMLSALIAFITTALDQKIQELKRGHSKVIEEEHTLILGWNEQRIVECLRELILANESEKDACVVILANHDKQEMDDVIRLRISDSVTTRIVTRSGNVSSLANLNVASVETCKSIVILAECSESATREEKATSDAKVIQTVLACTSLNRDVPVVAEIFNDDHRKILLSSFDDNIITVSTSEILAKLLVQTSRSVGLSVVYNEILSFDGCEMYLYEDEWGGVAFRDLPYRFPDGVPMGVYHGDGSFLMNPPIDYQLKDDDQILILAEDDSTIEFLPKPVVTFQPIPLADCGHVEQQIERELILGWTHKTPIILREYADYVKPGSQIDILLKHPTDEEKAAIEAIDAELADISISLIRRNGMVTEELDSLKPFEYDNIIILADDREQADSQKTDSENIITLLQLRTIFNDHADEAIKTKLITEVLDSQNYSLVAKAGVKDIIISNRLISMIFAQISENAEIKKVYDSIFEEEGSEIYLKPASYYFKEFPVKASFAQLIDIAQQREEVCLGVKIKQLENKTEENSGIKLIPEKSRLYELQPDDCLIVLSEDES